MSTLSRRLVAAAFLASAACSSAPLPEENPATSVAAIQLANITGSGLPAKTIALTFDDGPGSRTLELSAFLKAEGIQATFFVNGRCFLPGNSCGNTLPAAAILAQVQADGHLVGNHTQDHLNLTTAFPAGADGDASLLDQVTLTDAVIAPYVDQNHFLFRAPFGAWNQRADDVISASAMTRYVGPIHWNIGGAMAGTDATGYAADWDCWQNENGFGIKSSTVCADRYMNEIHAVGRGISLMHDVDRGGTVNNHDLLNGGGNTVDMVKLVLVPKLKAEGYTFVRADAISAIAIHFPIVDASVPDAADASDAADADADAEDASVDDADAADTSVEVVDAEVAPDDASAAPDARVPPPGESSAAGVPAVPEPADGTPPVTSEGGCAVSAAPRQAGSRVVGLVAIAALLSRRRRAIVTG